MSGTAITNTPSHHQMKVNTVLLSTTPDEIYYSFWNQTSYVYTAKLGITPHLIFLGSEDQLKACRLSDRYGRIHRVDQVEGVHTRWGSPWGTFYVSMFVEDREAVCLTIGVDQIPLSFRYLDTGDNSDPDKYYVSLKYNSNRNWRTNAGINIPSSWHIAKAKTFQRMYEFEPTWEQEIRKLDNITDLNCRWGGADQHEPGGKDKWGIDESYSTRKMRARADEVVELWDAQKDPLPRLHPKDITYHRYDDDRLTKEAYMEAHMPRPTRRLYRRQRDLFLRKLSDREFTPAN